MCRYIFDNNQNSKSGECLNKIDPINKYLINTGFPDIVAITLQLRLFCLLRDCFEVAFSRKATTSKLFLMQLTLLWLISKLIP